MWLILALLCLSSFSLSPPQRTLHSEAIHRWEAREQELAEALSEAEVGGGVDLCST